MDLFGRIAHDLEQVLTDLTVDALPHQPGPGSHSIAWLAWHLTRSHGLQRGGTHDLAVLLTRQRRG